ncbi:uncharacterized protein LOC126932548 [Macaca thibetana thibetana]|uniref:uncharacterized protein LOC126932548 n=1 Tax=Macaca thibetana thibetana TaxID=257877 RepID=UPI0021BC3C28|nr:uncharacterized protein LOC126932548 [Macaca thibetana thibetana]
MSSKPSAPPQPHMPHPFHTRSLALRASPSPPSPDTQLEFSVPTSGPKLAPTAREPLRGEAAGGEAAAPALPHLHRSRPLRDVTDRAFRVPVCSSATQRTNPPPEPGGSDLYLSLLSLLSPPFVSRKEVGTQSVSCGGPLWRPAGSPCTLLQIMAFNEQTRTFRITKETYSFQTWLSL